MARLLLSIDDLADEEIHQILARAAIHRDGGSPDLSRSRAIVGLLFLEPSLRTRVGFAAAALRLGWHAIDILELRGGNLREGWRDTLRTVSGYVDVIAARADRPLVHTELAGLTNVPLINAGDAGLRAQHPSQALIDVFAIEQQAGSLSQQRIAVCGDLRTRSARSLIALLARIPPARLVLISVDSLPYTESLPDALLTVTELRRPWEIDDVDVLYVAGTPFGVVTEADRDHLRVDEQVLRRLPATSVVLCPMPVIDEMSEAVRSDPRLRMFEQSDAGLFVRMAVLEYVLGFLPALHVP